MKKIKLLIGLILISGLVFSDDKKAGADDVVVKKLEVPMPNDENMRAKFLWDNFANKPEEMLFSSYLSDNWKKDYIIFAEALVSKARNNKLDTDSLQKILSLIQENPKNYGDCLPVGAYQTTLNSEPIWIIIIKWGQDKPRGLSHVKMLAYDQKNLKQVAFNTCR